MKILSKERKWWDYWELHLNFPWVGKQPISDGIFTVENATQYGVKMPTCCILIKEPDIYWKFRLNFFGFGFTIIRQNGY